MKQTHVDTNAEQARSHLEAVVRRARATDLEGFDCFLAGLSVETSTRRFFTPTAKLSRRQARLLLDNDATRGAWLAVTGEAVVAHACWVALAPDTAELAMVVADGCQRHGIGRRLMRSLLEELGGIGMSRMEMVVQPDNRRIVDLIARAWPDARARSEDGVLTFVTPLSTEGTAAA
jgi:GNAT superfamily N-acetyltransferase